MRRVRIGSRFDRIERRYLDRCRGPCGYRGVMFGSSSRGGAPMPFLLGTLVMTLGLLAQSRTTSSDPVRTVVGRLELEQYKAHIKGLAQFGDRMQGTQGNRDAIDWLERQLLAFGYS